MRRRKKLIDLGQDLALVLLAGCALFLLGRLPLVRGVRLPSQTLFAAPGGAEEAALPAGMFPPVHLMITGDSEYGRYGRLCAAAGGPDLQSITPLFREALGSAGAAVPAEDAELRDALGGPGVYLELAGEPLPLEAVAAWLGEEAGPGPAVRAMALSAGGEGSAGLYLLDGEGGVTARETALPASAVRSVCDGFAPNGARFAYESDHAALSPYTALTAEDALPADAGGGLPAGYSAYNLLTALDFNAHTLSRYRESGGAEVVEEAPRTLRISPDGLVEFTSRGEGDSALYRAAGQGAKEVLAAAWRLASALTEGSGASELCLWAMEPEGDGWVLAFRYQLEGVPVFFSDGGDALTVAFRGGSVAAFTYRCRAYGPLEEETAALPGPLPAAMAQAIAASFPGSGLSIGYEDDGTGRVCARWIR